VLLTLHTSVRSQWLSAVHATHWFVALQCGAVPGQSASSRHLTHESVAGLQCGVAISIEQFVSERHCTQLPLGMSQYGYGAPQFASLVQKGTQVCVPRLHCSVALPQLLSVRHSTHTLAAVSQYGTVPGQFAFDVHATQVFVVVLQAGLPGTVAHPVSSTHCTHESVVGSHTGSRGFLQSVLVRHSTQLWSVMSHIGSPEPRQFVLLMHCTHKWLPASQYGVGAEHCPSEMHGTHFCAVRSQAGVGAAQSPLSRHSTHAILVASHAGVGDAQWVSARQPTHTWFAVSHAGMGAAH